VTSLVRLEACAAHHLLSAGKFLFGTMAGDGTFETRTRTVIPNYLGARIWTRNPTFSKVLYHISKESPWKEQDWSLRMRTVLGASVGANVNHASIFQESFSFHNKNRKVNEQVYDLVRTMHAENVPAGCVTEVATHCMDNGVEVDVFRSVVHAIRDSDMLQCPDILINMFPDPWMAPLVYAECRRARLQLT
jgi:hypothetical protein